jgi:IS5 family transposase
MAGVDLGVAAAPVETMILRFRHLLEQHELCGKMLDRHMCLAPQTGWHF